MVTTNDPLEPEYEDLDMIFHHKRDAEKYVSEQEKEKNSTDIAYEIKQWEIN